MIEKTSISPPTDIRTNADSGATVHCFYNSISFIKGSIMSCSPSTVMLSNNPKGEATRCGEVQNEFENSVTKLSNALYIPDLGYKLVLTGKLVKHEMESRYRLIDILIMLEGSAEIISHESRNSVSRLYALPSPCDPKDKSLVSVMASCRDEIM